ncbi:MAG TPA: phospholipid-binding protein [Trichocoleus sp.]
MSIMMQAIPPERVGVRGEYDHYGLAKRVWLNCCEAVGADAIANLSVKQRGSVVILHGQIQSQSLLEQLIQVAMQVEGTTNVEVRGVQVTVPA